MFLISISVPGLALSADVAMRRRSEENLGTTQSVLGRRWQAAMAAPLRFIRNIKSLERQTN
jgi:hypothetical protein